MVLKRPAGQGTASKGAVPWKWTLIVLAVTLLCVIVPFLFWRATWFGRPLSDAEMQRDLTDLRHPRATQHALSQVADRIIRGDHTVVRWYPDVVRLANDPVDQVRLTAAWVMGQDNTVPQFHQALLRLLSDRQPMVRMNAALALVRFGDPVGRGEILSMLRPIPIAAPAQGVLKERLKPGEAVNPDILLGRIVAGKQKVEIRSSASGALSRWALADGSTVSARQTIAWLEPGSQIVWEALRALYLIGRPEDLPEVMAFARGVPGMPPEIQRQALATAEAIRRRAAETRSPSQ
jgi:biotin carboxyl carrier protein